MRNYHTFIQNLFQLLSGSLKSQQIDGASYLGIGKILLDGLGELDVPVGLYGLEGQGDLV